MAKLDGTVGIGS